MSGNVVHMPGQRIVQQYLYRQYDDGSIELSHQSELEPETTMGTIRLDDAQVEAPALALHWRAFGAVSTLLFQAARLIAGSRTIPAIEDRIR